MEELIATIARGLVDDKEAVRTIVRAGTNKSGGRATVEID